MRRFTVLLIAFCFLVLFGWGPSAAAANEPGGEETSLLIINKRTNKLAYFHDGALVKVFPVATGKTEKLTPEGTFPIVNKIKNRPYYKEKIAGGDPGNPLGDRWLGLQVGSTNGTTYAIHGNNNESSIGKYVSSGCIRMHNEDIHWLFDEIALNTKVVITSSKLSFEQLADKHDYEFTSPLAGEAHVNGKIVSLQKKLVLYRGMTYISLRTAFELAGGSVQWDEEKEEITAMLEGRLVIFQPDHQKWTVNDAPMEWSEAPILRKGTVMVPLRDIAGVTGWTVQWDGAARKVYLYKN